jgi:hypothetical protein
VTDSGDRRLLDAAHPAEHLEHACALTGHGAHGATVEWAGVIGWPSEFAREWAYTSKRARVRARLPTWSQRRRRGNASARSTHHPSQQRTGTEAIEILRRCLRRIEAETLALDQVAATDMTHPPHAGLVLLTELHEAGAERTILVNASARGPGWQAMRGQQRRETDRGLER